MRRGTYVLWPAGMLPEIAPGEFSGTTPWRHIDGEGKQAWPQGMVRCYLYVLRIERLVDGDDGHDNAGHC